MSIIGWIVIYVAASPKAVQLLGQATGTASPRITTGIVLIFGVALLGTLAGWMIALYMEQQYKQ